MNTPVTHTRHARLRAATATMFIAVASILINMCAQPFCRVRTFRMSDGLPSHNISRITQDPDDLLWVATWGGLTNFDGRRFLVYRSGPRNGTLPTNRITSIWPDSCGRIWLHLYGELPYYLDTATGSFIPVYEDVERKIGGDYHCRSVSVTPSGIWLIGSRGKPTVRLSTQNPTDTALMEIWDSPKMSAIGASNITRVKATGNGEEWIYSDSGITKYGSDLHADGTFLNPVALEGTYFFLSTDGRVYTYSDGKLSAIPSIPGRPKVNTAIPFGSHHIAVATDAGIAVYDAKSRRWSMHPSPDSARVTDIFSDSQQRIWAFTGNGDILLCNPSTGYVKHIAADTSAGQHTVTRRPLWLEDPSGTIWLAPRNKPFGYYDETTGTIKPVPLASPQLNYSIIPSIERYFIDSQSNLWLSSAHDLTCVTFGRRSINIVPLEGNEEVRALHIDPDGNLLAGTANGVIGYFDATGKPNGYLTAEVKSGGDATARISTSRQPFSYRIYTITTDSKGTMWIGTKGEGLYTIDPKGHITNYRRTSDPYSIGCDSIYQVIEDKRGRIWLATYGSGIHIAQPDRTGGYRFIHCGNDMNGYPADGFNRVRRIEEGPDGVMLLSTTEGLLTVDGRSTDAGKMKFYRTTHIENDTTSLSTPNVMQTLVSKNGNVYVATMEGVQLITDKNLLSDGLHLRNVAMRHDSPGIDNVLALGETPDGRLCIVRESAIIVYNPATGSDRIMTHTDNAEFTEALPVCGKGSHLMWSGALGGPAWFDPDAKAPGTEHPEIIITRVLHGSKQEVDPALNPSHIEIGGNDRALTIEFAALDYADNASLRYAYHLDNDSVWHHLGGTNKIKFDRLTPGQHTLYLRSTNSNGSWVNNIKELNISVAPSFWESWTGRVVIVLIILAVLAAIVVFYILRRDNARMSEINEQQRRTLEEITRVMHEQSVAAQAAKEAEEARLNNKSSPAPTAPPTPDYRLESPTIVDEDQEMMQRLLKFLDTRIGDENLKIEELAEAVNMGRTVFYGKIKALVGMSPSDFLRRLRLQRAQELIANSRMSFSQIAFAVGFSDPKYFTKCFKKETGMTPSEFRSKAHTSE